MTQRRTQRRTRRPAHVAAVRPRYARLTAAGSALAVTLVTLLGGIGLLPEGTSAAAASGPGSDRAASLSAATLKDVVPSIPPPPTEAVTKQDTPDAALPSDTGTGRRVVFDISDQRVWLVEPGTGGSNTGGSNTGGSNTGASNTGGSDDVVRSYLVSGSLTDNLDPGTYAVYSRSRSAVGVDDSGVMEYFVRFTRGEHAAIGFHSIPTKDGHPLQTAAQLGTPQSHGCIRQALPDARKLWDFAPVGTKVVVTA